MEFLDIIENGWAGDRNPRKKGIFIRNKGRTIQLTNGKGDFWELMNDPESRSKYYVIGNLLRDSATDPIEQHNEVKAV
jgi:hypothetical protein